jgi:hypothetical protein
LGEAEHAVVGLGGLAADGCNDQKHCNDAPECELATHPAAIDDVIGIK